MYQIFAHDLEQSFGVFNHPPSSSAHRTAEFNKNQRCRGVFVAGSTERQPHLQPHKRLK